MKPEIVRRINALFGERTMLLTPLDAEPRLVPLGPFVPPPRLRRRIDYWRDVLSAPGRYNEPQAILAGTLDLSAPVIAIPYRALDYATAHAMREGGGAPPVLSVGTVAVCPARRTLYVHRRAKGAQPAPSMLHSFSGGYRMGADGPERCPVTEGLREFGEETGLGTFTLDHAFPPPRLALFRDNDYGALEICLLGVTLTPEQVDRLSPTTEGEACEIAFDALPGSLMNGVDPWTEGGKLEVLTWLALGAPPCATETRFGRLSGMELVLAATA